MKDKRWEKMVEQFAEKGRFRLWSDILYREDVVKLLRRQHAAMVRAIRKRSKEYMLDANDYKLSKSMQAVAASKAWAFKDFADDFAALATKKGK